MSKSSLFLRQQDVNRWGITVTAEAIRVPLKVPRRELPTRKSRSHSSKSAKKTMSPKTPKKRSSCSAKVTTTEVDILSPAAMENIYYIAHNAADCLEFRGFGWPNSKKKKKGTKRKKN
ncbi:small lysine-rich protein 1 [Maylandia zebra]|nr:small lysine-rich protein 1 [Maylandia zebra]